MSRLKKWKVHWPFKSSFNSKYAKIRAILTSYWLPLTLRKKAYGNMNISGTVLFKSTLSSVFVYDQNIILLQLFIPSCFNLVSLDPCIFLGIWVMYSALGFLLMYPSIIVSSKFSCSIILSLLDWIYFYNWQFYFILFCLKTLCL